MECYEISPEAHHYMAVEMNNQAWALLARSDRNDDDNHRMEHFALASLYHWERSDRHEPVHTQRGHWLLSRVYATVGDTELALTHASHCMLLTSQLDIRDFDLAYAFEAKARSNAACGNFDKALTFYNLSLEACESIADSKDRELFLADLEDEPWFGLDI